MRILWLSLPLLLSACSGLQQMATPPAVANPEAEKKLVKEAQELTRQGGWSQAIEVLEAARKRYPESAEIATKIKEINASWEQEKRLLEDRILVIETAALIRKLPLLEKLAEGDRGDYLLQSRRLFWKEYTRTRIDPLLLCSRMQQSRNPRLALSCLRLAQRIEPSKELEQEIARIDQAINSRKQASVVRQQKGRQEAKRDHVERLVSEARQEMEQGTVTEAMQKFDEALRLDPENAQVRRYLAAAQSELQLQVTSLVQLGDRLYRDEQIGPAVAVWEAALELDPNQDQVVEKVARAQRVLKKLEQIRTRELP